MSSDRAGISFMSLLRDNLSRYRGVLDNDDNRECVTTGVFHVEFSLVGVPSKVPISGWVGSLVCLVV